MKSKRLGLIIIILMCLQPTINDNQKLTINNSIAPNISIPRTDSKITNSVNYKLEAYSGKSSYSLTENIDISVALYNLDTKSFILDTVLVTTPLNSRQYQLSNNINELILGKSNFVVGLNIITVSYKTQSIQITILRQNANPIGNISTMLGVTDILNSQPAPGVPNNISFTLSNSVYQVFPTDQNEYVQVSMNYNAINLVLATKFYSLNEFIQSDKINFNIPSFLPINSYQLLLSYSGDEFLKPASLNISITIHDFTPIINTSLSSKSLDTSSVLNETTNSANIRIEGYLPTDLRATISLQNSTIYTIGSYNVTSYRSSLPIPVSQQIPSGYYILKVTYYSTNILNSPVTYTFPVQVVEKIQLIIRKDVQFVTLGQPVLFDFFCYDPATFSGVGCNITMNDGLQRIFSLITTDGHLQKTLTFNNIDTALPHIFLFNVIPQLANNLYMNNIQYSIHFYHNSTVNVVLQQNIVDKNQLISLYADNNGQFHIFNENNLIINSFDYLSAGSYVNYFLNLNSTHRGLNILTVKFTPKDNNYSNATLLKNIYVYDKIIIQNVQTNASFYQLGSYILFQGIATLGSSLDSLNNIKVSLLLNNQIISNTTIQNNAFTFIVQVPNSTGLKKYNIVIYADNTEFIITSDLYEVTISVINNFGLNFASKEYQVGDTIPLTVYGLQNREYLLYYVINNTRINLKDFIYSQIFNYSLKVTQFGHYLIYLKEKKTGDQCYYALDVLQNPSVQLHYNLLKTFVHNNLTITINNYIGSITVKIDNLNFENNVFNINANETFSVDIFNKDPGNHSVILTFSNQFTKEKVRTFFITIFQNIQLLNFTYNDNSRLLIEGDTATLHLRFKDFTNASLNDIPIEIITNDNTILAQAIIFNSESDLQLTIIGNALSLRIKTVSSSFIHEEQIPLNLTVYKLISSDIKNSYYFDSATNLQIHFFYKYFPTKENFSIVYQLLKDGSFLQSDKTFGQDLILPLTENGNYNLTITVSGLYLINRTFQTSLMLRKLFDISNTNLITTIGFVLLIPIAILGLTLVKKKKFIQ